MTLKKLTQFVPAVVMALLTAGVASAEDSNPVDSPDASARVELTVSELQQLLNLPPGATLQEAPDTPKRLFKDMSEVERFLNKRPVICAIPDAPDPMIIPWVRERVVAESLLAEAMTAKEEKDDAKAVSILREILDKYPDTPARAEAAREFSIISGVYPGGGIVCFRGDRPFPPLVLTLPDWVPHNLTGVVISDGKKPVAVVGPEFLRVGDVVPKFPAVRVKSIAPSEVVFEYQGKEFPVEVVGAL